jgi:hypothetical protein
MKLRLLLPSWIRQNYRFFSSAKQMSSSSTFLVGKFLPQPVNNMRQINSLLHSSLVVASKWKERELSVCHENPCYRCRCHNCLLQGKKMCVFHVKESRSKKLFCYLRAQISRSQLQHKLFLLLAV